MWCNFLLEPEGLNLDRSVVVRRFAVIAEWFNALAQAPDGGDCARPRQLDGGCIRVLTVGDTGPLQAILTTWPEYAESVQTGAGSASLWKIVVMVDNDCFDTWFAPEGVFPTLDAWVQPYVGNDR